MAKINYTEAGNRLTITTNVLKADTVLVTSFVAHEQLSRLFVCHIDLISETADIEASTLIGQPITLNVESPDGTARYFNGYITRFTHRGTDDRVTLYRAEISPWLWFLTRTSNCRIFQNKDVKEIIQAVFSAAGFSDFEISQVTGNHPKREYCVQYRESDFDFVSRLMEDEGIFYYINHTATTNVMVMGDQVMAYHDCAEKTVNFAATGDSKALDDQIIAWEHGYQFRSGSYAIRDYNFITPSTDLSASTNTLSTFTGVKETALYDYPGIYTTKSDGTAISKLRMEETEVTCDVVSASSRCHSFGPGGRFTIGSHQVAAEAGKSYVITSIAHSVSMAGGHTSGGTAGSNSGTVDYTNTFECIPDKVVYRPERSTPKPFIRGAQTALVVGPSGQEIYVDQYGRVKVQFYWDRYGVKDDKSSCWIRVSQITAGSSWGSFFWPRIAQEVVVTFLEGDPDRPLITGNVYNAERMPHYKLPDQKTKSGIKSNSSMGGGGFNEFRLEDKKGKEQIFVHAERNLDVKVKHDTHETIDGTRHMLVGGNQYEKVGSTKYPADKHLTVTQDLIEEIDNEHSLTIKGDQFISIVKNQNMTVAEDQMVHVKKDSHFHCEQNRNEKIEKKLSVNVTGDINLKSAANYAVEAATAIHLKGAQICIEAASQLTLKVGGNFVSISSAGVAIVGSMVMINSGGAAGAGPGSSPTDPTDPTDPEKVIAPGASDDDTAGKVDKQAAAAAAAIAKLALKKLSPAGATPAATALKDAAVAGTPFCAMCALASAVLK